MTGREAEQILDWLTGSFGKRLDENERLVWLATLAEMDATKAMNVALQIAKNGERFPTVPDFRRSVRGNAVRSDDSWRNLPPEALPIPEFVSVWYWSICTRENHRPFPQFVPKPRDAMSMAEYESLREEWQAAGGPRVKSVNQIIKAVG